MDRGNVYAGCYVDELNGVYAPLEACKMARRFGWSGRMPTDIEDSWEQSDEALDWLNENVADDEHSFGWYNGGLYYWSITDWQSVS